MVATSCYHGHESSGIYEHPGTARDCLGWDEHPGTARDCQEWDEME
jgi:hypothetical protein